MAEIKIFPKAKADNQHLTYGSTTKPSLDPVFDAWALIYAAVASNPRRQFALEFEPDGSVVAIIEHELRVRFVPVVGRREADVRKVA